MNNKAYIDWPALLLILAALGWTGYQFSRRTYRITVLVAAIAGVVAVTEYGVAIRSVTNFVDGFKAGSKDVIETMLNALVPATQNVVPGIVGWGVLLVLCGGLLVWFDTWSARREQPRVDVTKADRSALAEELQFRLPAVYVRKPATMPGGSTLDNLASVVSELDVKGGKTTAALMQVIHILEGQPRTYEARMFVEPCTLGGQLCSGGSRRRITVDLKDARTGQSLAVHMLPACRLEEAAEQVAGFIARQVFSHDPSTPAWVVGSHDGDHLLSAYVLSGEVCAAGRTFGELWQSRQQRRKILEPAVNASSAPGLVGYELAAMYDMDGENLKSLLLHLRNRVYYPQFWPGRYRLAMSLSMRAGPLFYQQLWSRGNVADGAAQRELARAKAEISWRLDEAGLLRRLPPAEAESLRHLRDHDAATVRTALLHVAEQEFRACRRAAGTASVLWNSFWHREMRAWLLQTIRGDLRWLHPRRRRLASSIAIEIVTQRRKLLAHAAGADDSLTKAQERVWHILGVDRMQKGLGWLAARVPWQSVYNAASLFALSAPGEQPTHEKVSKVINLLRLAIEDPGCDLEHPSECIAMDPDLRPLRRDPEFRRFVTELAAKDFAPSAPVQLRDTWFCARLPMIPPVVHRDESPINRQARGFRHRAA